MEKETESEKKRGKPKGFSNRVKKKVPSILSLYDSGLDMLTIQVIVGIHRKTIASVLRANNRETRRRLLPEERIARKSIVVRLVTSKAIRDFAKQNGYTILDAAEILVTAGLNALLAKEPSPVVAPHL